MLLAKPFSKLMKR